MRESAALNFAARKQKKAGKLYSVAAAARPRCGSAAPRPMRWARGAAAARAATAARGPARQQRRRAESREIAWRRVGERKIILLLGSFFTGRNKIHSRSTVLNHHLHWDHRATSIHRSRPAVTRSTSFAAACAHRCDSRCASAAGPRPKGWSSGPTAQKSSDRVC